MDNLKIGEYVRTDIEGIGKVIEIRDHRVYLDNEKDVHITNVIKHSFNIKKLIEARDYVNGNKVYDSVEGLYIYDTEVAYKHFNGNTAIHHIAVELEIQDDDFIKTILTKEQYERNIYEVKEEQ